MLHVCKCSLNAWHLRLNNEPLEEVDGLQYLGWLVAGDGGCERNVVHRMNEEWKASRVLQSVLSNRGLWLNEK